MDEELSSESDTSSVICWKVEDRGFCFDGLGALQCERVAEQNRGIEEHRTEGCRTEQRNRGTQDRGLQNRAEA